MGVKLALWGAIGSGALDVAAVPRVGETVFLNGKEYPVLAISYGTVQEKVYAKVGPGVPNPLLN